MKQEKRIRGDATDPMIILVVLFFLAITFLIGIYINSIIGNIMSDSVLSDSAAFSSISSALSHLNAVGIQRAFAMIMGLMVVFVMGSAFLTRVHPAFMFLYIIFLVATVLTSVFIGNIYVIIQENPALAIAIEDQNMIHIIMNNIVKITMAIGGLSMFIVFSKIFTDSGGGDGGRF